MMTTAGPHDFAKCMKNVREYLHRLERPDRHLAGAKRWLEHARKAHDFDPTDTEQAETLGECALRVARFDDPAC